MSNNSAYFEHCYLASQMGVPRVEGQDLTMGSDDCVYMNTIYGLVPVHGKPVNESGGYGVIVGDRSSREELELCRTRIESDPRNYVAQPIVQLSTAPTCS